VGQSPSWQANNHSASQGIQIYWTGRRFIPAFTRARQVRDPV